MAQTYSLATTTYSCEFRRSVILLDVAGDRYLRIAGDQVDLFREIANGPAPGTKAARYAADLVRKGLITEGAGGRPLISVPQEIDKLMLPRSAINLSPTVSATDLFRFLRSLCAARRMRRRTSLLTQLETAANWKRRVTQAPRAPSAARAASFFALAPFFFSARDACYFRSLALLHFLFQSRNSADWVFGVRDTPFEAHCWLESGPFVLNDEPDHVACFRRILTV